MLSVFNIFVQCLFSQFCDKCAQIYLADISHILLAFDRPAPRSFLIQSQYTITYKYCTVKFFGFKIDNEEQKKVMILQTFACIDNMLKAYSMIKYAKSLKHD